MDRNKSIPASHQRGAVGRHEDGTRNPCAHADVIMNDDLPSGKGKDPSPQQQTHNPQPITPPPPEGDCIDTGGGGDCTIGGVIARRGVQGGLRMGRAGAFLLYGTSDMVHYARFVQRTLDVHTILISYRTLCAPVHTVYQAVRWTGGGRMCARSTSRVLQGRTISRYFLASHISNTLSGARGKRAPKCDASNQGSYNTVQGRRFPAVWPHRRSRWFPRMAKIRDPSSCCGPAWARYLTPTRIWCLFEAILGVFGSSSCFGHSPCTTSLVCAQAMHLQLSVVVPTP